MLQKHLLSALMLTLIRPRASKLLNNKSTNPSPLSSMFRFSLPHTPPLSTSGTRKPAKPLPALMPMTIHLAAYSVTITRRRAERALMLGSMGLAVERLWCDMGAKTEAVGRFQFPFICMDLG